MIKVIVWLLLVSTLHAELKITKATGSIIRTKGKLQTGSSSRLELELPYLGIVRVGSNADFKYSPDGRDLKLDKGTLLFSSPKGSGDVIISSGPVATAITNGGDLEVSNVGGNSKVIVLNGKVVASLVKNPSQARKLRAGQMVDVLAGATSMPSITAFKMAALLKTSILFNMGDLPSKRAINQNATKQAPPRPFVTGGFDPDFNDSLVQTGPATAAAMIARMEQGAVAPLPVVPEGQVPTQSQAQLFAEAGKPIPNVTTAEGRLLLRGDRLRVLRALRERQRPPPIPVATPASTPKPPVIITPPIATPPPVPGLPLPSPRPTLRPPIAVP